MAEVAILLSDEIPYKGIWVPYFPYLIVERHKNVA